MGIANAAQIYHSEGRSGGESHGGHSYDYGQGLEPHFSRSHRSLTLLCRWDVRDVATIPADTRWVAFLRRATQRVTGLDCQSRSDGFESHARRHLHTPVAQLERYNTTNVVIEGSSPSGRTTRPRSSVEEHLAPIQVAADSTSAEGSMLLCEYCGRRVIHCTCWRKLMRDSSVVERRAHNSDVVDSISTPATIRYGRVAQLAQSMRLITARPAVRGCPRPPYAGIAQLVEHLFYTQDVEGSIPSSRTTRQWPIGWALAFQARQKDSISFWRSNRGWTRSSEVEPAAHNRLVLGSKPSGSTKLPGSSSVEESMRLLSVRPRVQIPSARPTRRQRRCVPQALDMQHGLLNQAFQFDSGLGPHRLCAGDAMVAYRPFKARVRGSSPRRRTIRRDKRTCNAEQVDLILGHASKELQRVYAEVHGQEIRTKKEGRNQSLGRSMLSMPFKEEAGNRPC